MMDAPAGESGDEPSNDSDDDDESAPPRVRALAEDSDKPARKAAARSWPPVDPGNHFVLFVEDLNLERYSTSTVEIPIAVNDDGALVCAYPGCKEKDFGKSKMTRAPFNAAKHLRCVHLPKFLISAVPGAPTAASSSKKRKMAAGPPVAGRSLQDGVRGLGMTVVSSSTFAEQQKRRDEAAKAERAAAEEKAKERQRAMAAATAAMETDTTNGDSGASSSGGPRSFEYALTATLAGALVDERQAVVAAVLSAVPSSSHQTIIDAIAALQPSH